MISIMKADYTLKVVPEIFPTINPRTVQVWVSRGVIQPEIQSAGQGFPVRFTFLNLVEIGLVWQLVKLGVDSHEYLRKTMEHRRKLRLVNGWIDSRYHYDCLFIVLELSAFAAPLNEAEYKNYGEGPLFFLIKREDLNNFFKENATPGWLIVDVFAIKKYVDEKLASL